MRSTLPEAGVGGLYMSWSRAKVELVVVGTGRLVIPDWRGHIPRVGEQVCFRVGNNSERGYVSHVGHVWIDGEAYEVTVWLNRDYA